MSQRTCTVHAFDMFGLIHVSVRITDHHSVAPELGSLTEYSTTATILSTGEGEPVEWLQQALMGLLESL